MKRIIYNEKKCVNEHNTNLCHICVKIEKHPPYHTFVIWLVSLGKIHLKGMNHLFLEFTTIYKSINYLLLNGIRPGHHLRMPLHTQEKPAVRVLAQFHSLNHTVL